MRNLKRALSLTLASVMLLGMMVVGSSAAAGYDDVDVNDNVEAIEVLQAVEVMVGDDRGFGPDRPVTRNEMAVVMGKLLNLDYNYYSETCPFTDVASWAKGWVGAAAANGIVSGRGNGIYDGEATVTAVEAASMMMRALGYFKYQNDYADGFQVSTVRQGTKIGIFDQVGTDATTPMTRNQVAQMALNALKTGMVEPDGNTINLTTPDGTVFTGKVNYVYVTSNKPFATAISSTRASSMGSSNDSPIVELGEQLYDGKLKLFDRASDDFLRPSRRWEYDGKAIGTYMKKELIRGEYTVEVTGKDLYDLLGADTIKTYSFDIAIDGVDIDGNTGSTKHNDVLQAKALANSYFDETFMAKTYKTGVGQTGKGVLTQVFVNPDTKEVDVAVINTYLAKAAADYNEKRDELKLDVYGVEKTGSGNNTVWYKETGDCSLKDGNSEDFTVSNEDFNVADVKKDDIMMITQANGSVITIDEPEVMSAVTLNAFSLDKYVINEGTQYDYNTTIEYDPDTLEYYTSKDNPTQQLKDTEYNLYLDAYGYLIGVEIVEAQKNYIFLTGIDQGTSNLNNKVSDAAGILLDGTFINFKMNMIDSETNETASNANPTAVKSFFGHPLWNTWCTYTVDKDGNYTLREVANGLGSGVKAAQYHDMTLNNKTIDTKRVSLKAAVGYAYGNDDSVYIVPEVKTVAIRDKVKTSFKMPNNGSFTDVDHTNDPDTYGTGTAATDLDVGKNAVIISGVDSRNTGIDNVDLVTWTTSQIFSAAETNATDTKVWPGNVYTLYDDDNYIIGAVVVGEDNGATKNWVYVNSSSVKRESYDAAEDEWTWIREVISEGAAIDVTEKGSGLSELKKMTQNTWYELTYKADGTVKAANHAYFAEAGKRIGGFAALPSDRQLVIGYTFSGTDYFAGANFTDNVEWLENMNVNGKSTYLYEEVWGKGDDECIPAHNTASSSAGTNNKTTNKGAILENNQPRLEGGTLYMDYNLKKGVYVASDVKSALIQTNDGKETIVYGDDRDDLRYMLDDLNYDKGTYLFKISAVIKDGRATTVIIHDWNETDATGNGGVHGGNNGNNGGNHPAGILVDTTTKTALKYYNSNSNVSSDQAAQDISQWLIDEGWEILEGPEVDNTGVFVWKATNNGGKTKYTFKWTPNASGTETEVAEIYVDGMPYAFAPADGCAKLLQLAGVETSEQSSYIKRTTSSNVVSFKKASDHGTTLADGDKLVTGYLKVVDNAGAADVSSLVAMTGLEANTGATDAQQHYALPETAIAKLSTENASATGLAAGASGSLAYVPYNGGTYGAINAADGTTNDWTATISAIGKVKITFVDHTTNPVPATTTYVTAQAHGDMGARNHANLKVNTKALSTFGTHYYINSSTTAVANAEASATSTIADGDTIHIGYVQTSAKADTGVAATGLTVTWSDGADTAKIVPVGTEITATLTFSDFTATGAAKVITASQAAAITAEVNVAAGTGGTIDTSTTKWDNSAKTFTVKEDDVITGTVKITFKVGATGGTTDASPKLT